MLLYSKTGIAVLLVRTGKQGNPEGRATQGVCRNLLSGQPRAVFAIEKIRPLFFYSAVAMAASTHSLNRAFSTTPFSLRS